MATNYSQVSYGSKGSEVKKLQETLNSNGYSLDVDGNFGAKTQAAVKDYQKKNGLSVDGIVGKNTWGALTGFKPSDNAVTNGSSTGSAQTNSAAKAQTFDYGEYKQSDAVTQAQALLQQQMANQPGEYKSAWSDQVNAILDQIMNRDKFSYDLNGDALYQQYADQYVQQGKMAMMDTMGQAQAMTGGYGNSYAQSVGQQAYQAQLQNLNDVVPELYQMALDQYNQQGQDMLNQYSLLATQDEQDYGRYRDSVSDYYTNRQQAYDQYNTERDYDYSKYTDNRNFAYGEYSDDRAYDYQEERDAVSDEQWQKEYDFALQQYNDSQSSSGSSGSSSSGKSSSGKSSGKTSSKSSGGSYNNGSLKESEVKALQKALGVTADGKYGSKSKSAAGGLSAEEAYKKYVSGGATSSGGTTPASTASATEEKMANYVKRMLDNATSSQFNPKAVINASSLSAEEKEIALEILDYYISGGYMK